MMSDKEIERIARELVAYQYFASISKPGAVYADEWQEYQRVMDDLLFALRYHKPLSGIIGEYYTREAWWQNLSPR